MCASVKLLCTSIPRSIVGGISKLQVILQIAVEEDLMDSGVGRRMSWLSIKSVSHLLTWLPRYLATWLPGYLATWLPATC
eukprot:gene4556-6758_t